MSAWTCGACSTTNVDGADHCVVCHIARGSAPPSSTGAAREPLVPATTSAAPPVAPPPTSGAAAPGQGGVPLVAPAAPVASGSATDPAVPSGPPRRGVPVAALVAVLLVIAAIVAAVVVVGGGKSDQSGSEDVSADYDSGPSSGSASPDGDTYVEDDTTYDDTASDGTASDEGLDSSDSFDEADTTLAAEPEPSTWTASLHATFAKVRTEPSLSSATAFELNDEGQTIEVTGDITADGWYPVRVDGRDGYLFGAFVSPPASGYCVGTSFEAKPFVHDGFGSQVGGELSGNKVLMTASGPTDGQWPVVMPQGQRGFVADAELSVDSCG